MASEVTNGKGIVKWLPSVRRYRRVTKTTMVKHPWGMKPTHAAGDRELRGMARVSRGGVGVSINGRCSRLAHPESSADVLDRRDHARARTVQGIGSSLAPQRRTVASVLACPRPSRSPDARPSAAASAAPQEADRCFAPGSLPPGAACSISALISPPIRTKRPVTYIQVSSTMTAPMLP
jgi:hypothetical protein